MTNVLLLSLFQCSGWKLIPFNSGIFKNIIYLIISSLWFSVLSFCDSVSQMLGLPGGPVISLSFLFYFLSLGFLVILSEGFLLLNPPKSYIDFFFSFVMTLFPRFFPDFLQIKTVYIHGVKHVLIYIYI